MGILIYKAAADTGGAKGTEINSGIRGALLPKITSSDRLDGVTIYRKFYMENTAAESIALKVALDNIGEFNACFYESTGDAQVVGDLTGAETRYGASIITKVEDTTLASETVNGAGGLIDIKKITVTENVDYTIFRVGDKIGMGGALGDIGEIQSITDLGTELEITLVNEVTYDAVIGKYAHSYIEKTIPASSHESFWLEVYVEPNSITSKTMNALSLAEVY